jgi:hypothetical protein
VFKGIISNVVISLMLYKNGFKLSKCDVFMPQLDLVSYAAQFFWLTVIVGTYYVFCVSTLLPTTGTLLKARAAQEIDSASLSVSTPESDLESQAVFAHYLDFVVGDINESKSTVLYVARDIGEELLVEIDHIMAVGWGSKLKYELFAQLAPSRLQASFALCGAYGCGPYASRIRHACTTQSKGNMPLSVVQTLGSPGFFSYIVSKSLASKKGKKKLTGKAAKSTLAASKPKTAKTSGAKTSGKKKAAKKK